MRRRVLGGHVYCRRSQNSLQRPPGRILIGRNGYGRLEGRHLRGEMSLAQVVMAEGHGRCGIPQNALEDRQSYVVLSNSTNSSPIR
jgi:hypothetical protein